MAEEDDGPSGLGDEPCEDLLFEALDKFVPHLDAVKESRGALGMV